MTVDETIWNALHRIEEIFREENHQHEQLTDSLTTLHDQFLNIRDETSSLSIDEQQKLILDLKTVEFKLLHQHLIDFSSKLPSPVVNSLSDTIRFQIIADMQINPSMSDFYFKASLGWLTNEIMINYLMKPKSSAIASIDIDEQLLKFCCSIGAFAVYSKTKASPSMSVSRKAIPTYFELTAHTERLLQGFINYLNCSLLGDFRQSEVDISVLKWLLNMTDIYGFIPYFVKTGYPEAILEWMKVTNDREEKITADSWCYVINILYNLARHWIGVKSLNKLKTLQILQEWKNRYFSNSTSADMMKKFEDILVAYYLLYILLLEPREMKRENMTNIQTVLDHILERIVPALNSSTLNCGLYNVSEYLVGLTKLVVNDKVLLHIMSRDNLFDLFLGKFLEFNALCVKISDAELCEMNGLICLSFYTIFWSISFQSDLCTTLKTNTEFIQYVEQISKIDSKDEHIIAMKRAAKGILFNLDLVQTDFQPLDNVEQIDDDLVKVMISYAHKDTKLCQKLVNYLEGRVQGDMWVDFMKLKPPYEDDWEEIARAITQCDVVLMVVTENYCTSKSCRREVIHTDKRNKRIIPIYHGKEYQPEDWFEIRVGSATWVRFNDKKSDAEVVEVLLSLIHATEKKKYIMEQEKSHNPPNLTDQNQTIQSIVINPIAPAPAVMPLLRVISSPTVEISTPQPIVDLPSPSTTITSVVDVPKINAKPIEQWSQTEIQQLCQLHSAAFELNSGRAALTYINLLNTDEVILNEYETRMIQRGLTREQFSNMIASLINLRCLQRVEESSSYPPDQWNYEEIKCWFQRNRLPDHLFDTLNFVDGTELLIYAKLITTSPTRMDTEYDQLKSRIAIRYNREDLFHLDEYVRFINAAKKLLIRTESSVPYAAADAGQCTIS